MRTVSLCSTVALAGTSSPGPRPRGGDPGAVNSRGMKRLIRGLLTTLVLTTTVWIIQAPPAYACTCGRLSFSEMKASSDGMFVGVYKGTDDPGDQLYSARLVTHHFDVERVIKGDISDRVDVVTTADTASCGLPSMRLGTSYGLGLTREGEQWRSGLCMLVADGEGKWAPDPSGMAERRTSEPPFPWEASIVLVLPVLAGLFFLVEAVRRRGREKRPGA